MKSSYARYLFCICSLDYSFLLHQNVDSYVSACSKSHTLSCIVPLLPYCITKLCSVVFHVSLIFPQICLTVIYVSLSPYCQSVFSRPSLVMWRLTLVVLWASRTLSPLWHLLLWVQVYQVRHLGPPATFEVCCNELFISLLEVKWKTEIVFPFGAWSDVLFPYLCAFFTVLVCFMSALIIASQQISWVTLKLFYSGSGICQERHIYKSN